ncbi:MAG: DUF3795 domain-containing protein [Promethearchaeota archaeon]
MEKDKISEEETHLIAPCGIYCGACDTFLGKSSKLAKEIYRIIDGFNITDVGSFILGVDTKKIKNFLKILKKLSKSSKCPGCLGGGGNPMCPLKSCPKEKNLLTCAECNQMPCPVNENDRANPLTSSAGYLELISKRYNNWNIENLKKINKIGYRKFINEMQEQVKNGFLTSDVISKEMVFTDIMKKFQKSK